MTFVFSLRDSEINLGDSEWAWVGPFTDDSEMAAHAMSMGFETGAITVSLTRYEMRRLVETKSKKPKGLWVAAQDALTLFAVPTSEGVS